MSGRSELRERIRRTMAFKRMYWRLQAWSLSSAAEDGTAAAADVVAMLSSLGERSR